VTGDTLTNVLVFWLTCYLIGRIVADLATRPWRR